MKIQKKSQTRFFNASGPKPKGMFVIQVCCSIDLCIEIISYLLILYSLLAWLSTVVATLTAPCFCLDLDLDWGMRK